ncbi:MAG TPA: hypothetical protein VK790_08345 [Solirubrobacteraceae bacterium]|nr:hypothetical protein [Solirubrobacteraceae bacterium]
MVDRYNVVFAAVFVTAAVSVAAMLTIAEPLGDHLLGGGGFRFFPSVQHLVYRKPAEQMRYLLAVACALGLGVVFVRMRVPGVLRAAPLGRAGIRIASLGGQLAIVAVAVWSWWAQFHFADGEPPTTHFSNRNLLAAALVAGALILLVRARPHWLQERAVAKRRPQSWTWFAIAALLTACWLLPSVFREQNLAAASLSVTYHLQFTFDDFAAVANGRTPLVNYGEQYASLLPFAMWPVFRVAGTQVGVFTVTMCLFSMIGLLSVERVFALITRNERLALALYAPFLATSLFFILRDGSQLFSWASYYAVFPMRYAGPYVLLWVYTRHLRGLRPRGAIAVFALAGLVVLNNIEFGLSAYIAVVAATLVSSKFGLGPAMRLIRDAAIGLASATVAVAGLTVVLTGELPKIGLLTLYSRIFGEGGYGLLHTPTGGLYLIVDMTFASAFLVAAVRARDGAEDRAYTAVLAYAGVFGLGAGNYYMGRTHPGGLVVLFSIWALCVVLLALLSLRAIAAWHGRPRAPAWLLVVSATVSLGLVATALTQFPAPWTQLRRIATSAPPPPPYDVSAAVSFLRRTTRPGEPIVLLAPLGHVIALDAKVENVSPFSNQEGVVTYQQLNEELAALHEAGGTRFYLEDAFPEIAQGLASNGFSPVGSANGITEWRR